MNRKPTAIALTLLVSAMTIVSTGCATRSQPLYHWGTYPAEQYGYLKGDKGPEESIQALEKTREIAKSKGTQLPPGLQAHLGLLYGLTGKSDQFEQCLEAERQQFPESSTYVEFLLKNKQEEKAAQ